MGKNVPPVEIHRELVTVYGTNVMTVQHVRKWCRKFNSCRVKSRKGYVPRTHFFNEVLNKLIYCYDKYLNILGDYVEK
jgi:hypothetical protein